MLEYYFPSLCPTPTSEPPTTPGAAQNSPRAQFEVNCTLLSHFTFHVPFNIYNPLCDFHLHVSRKEFLNNHSYHGLSTYLQGLIDMFVECLTAFISFQPAKEALVLSHFARRTDAHGCEIVGLDIYRLWSWDSNPLVTEVYACHQHSHPD